MVLANGGHPFIEQNEHWGAAEGLVVSAWDILEGKVEPGKNVLVYDTICEFGGMSAADYLSEKGAQVEIVTDDTKPGVAMGGTTFPTYYRSMYPKDVIMTGDLMLEKVYREGDKVVAVLENEYTGAREERVVDQIVIENGVRPDESLYYALKQGSRNKPDRRRRAVRDQAATLPVRTRRRLPAVPHRRLRRPAQRARGDLRPCGCARTSKSSRKRQASTSRRRSGTRLLLAA